MKNNKFSIAIILLISLLVFPLSMLHAQKTISSDIHIDRKDKPRKEVSSVSGDIVIGNGSKVYSPISTVSGDITIGAKAEIGTVESVSGDISLGKGVSSGRLKAISGDIHLYSDTDVEGSVELVSGDFTSDSGAKIRGDIGTVSGEIELDDTVLRGDIRTVSGDISLFNGAIVSGDIIISRSTPRYRGNFGELKIVVDMNSIVKGNIRVKEPNTNVVVYLTNGGKVKGEIINAEVKK